MKKNLWLSLICISMAGATNAQDQKAAPPPPPPPPDLVAIPPAPPEPPQPFDAVLPPPPPEPPVPPVPGCPEPMGTTIINNNGYEISVAHIKGEDVVMLKKDGKKINIRLSKWNSDRKYYEKKYGQLPPPPPPVPLLKEAV